MEKVLLLCNKVPFPQRDGSTIAMASTIRGLLAADVELTVLALNTVKHRVSKLPETAPSEVYWVIHDVDTTPTAVGLLLNTLFSKVSYMVSRFNRNDIRSSVQSLLDNQTYDAVLIEGLFMMPYADEFEKRNIPYFMRAHNVENQIWNRQIQQERSPFKRWILRVQNKRLRKYEEAASKHGNGIVAITNVDASWFRKAAPTQEVLTVPTGINPKSYPNSPSLQPDVFHIGSMDWLPNIDGMRWFVGEVWPELMKINSQTAFHLAGRNSDQFGLHDPQRGIFVEGALDDVSTMYQKHGVFVVPLLAGSGMRIKILEAMAYGKAIVTTTIGAEGIPVVDGEHLLIADHPVEFARAIQKLIASQDLRLKLGENARAFAIRHFDEESLGQKLRNFMIK